MNKLHKSISIAASTVLLCAANKLQATDFFYGGDTIPSVGTYADWFTTVGPGHPTGGYFVGTEWSSDGDVLTMHTVHPNDYSGAPSLGIWFGRTDGYGDPSQGFNLASSFDGNHVDTRLALAPNSSEWLLAWFDANGYEAYMEFNANEFRCVANGNDLHIPIADMTAFHTYGSHIQNGQVSYYLDGALVLSGAAYTGPANFLLFGDTSATGVSGYGSLLVDYLDVNTFAGPAPVPEPTTLSLFGLGTLAILRLRKKL